MAKPSKRSVHSHGIANESSDNELAKFYGRHACKAIWRSRRDDIIRVYVTEEMIPTFQAVLQWCSKEKRAYHVVSKNDLEKIVDSVHHEGIAFVAKERPSLTKSQWEKLLTSSSDRTQILLIDGVSNPHNLGALMRTSAHFGIPLIFSDAEYLSPSACRIAEGGAEKVEIALAKSSTEAIEKSRSLGFKVVTTSSHGGTSLYKYKFPKKSLVVMGAETLGVSQSVDKLADDRIMIPGTGQVESLNVSVAWSLLAGEYWRQHRSSK